MVLGMPAEYFVHEVVRVLVYAALAIVCAERWRDGAWARTGAVAGAVGALLAAYYLGSWLLFVNGHTALMDLREDLPLDRFLTWADLLVLGGLCAAVVLGRTRARRPSAERATTASAE
ncbi:MAG: hypothetical protein VX747_00140 [Actinomycetota bacterium]|nr:hypothetical protein [Actinomycetota bacterium]